MKRPLAVLLLLVACGETQFVPLPEIEGVDTIVLRVGGTERVAAQVFAAPLLVELGDEHRLLYLSAYRESLSELGLVAGAVQPAACRSCALLEPMAVFELDTERDSDWRRLDVARDDVALSRLLPDADRCEVCTSHLVARVTHADSAPLENVVALPAGLDRALVLQGSSGAAYWVRSEGQTVLACQGPGMQGVSAAYAEGDEAVWTAGPDGALSRWEHGRFDPGLPCEVARTTTTAAAGETLGWIDGSPAGLELEVFGVGVSGQFRRYRPDGWQDIGVPLPGEGGTCVWIAPDRGMAATQGHRALWYANGAHQTQHLVLDAYEVQINSARRYDDVGLVLGTKPFILIFEDGQGGFRRGAPLLPIGERVESFARHDGSYFAAMSGGFLRELHPRRGYCEAQPVFVPHPNRYMVPLEDGSLVVGSTYLYRVRPVRSTDCR